MKQFIYFECSPCFTCVRRYNSGHFKYSKCSNTWFENAITTGRGQGNGRGRRPFFRQTGESDPYDMSIAPLNIYENQVLPVGLHNLSKSFRPNLSTIQVLSLGTKFIPKWKFEKTKKYVSRFQRFF